MGGSKMNLRVLVAVPTLLLLAMANAVAADASLAGSWALKIVSPQGTRTPAMTLTQVGNKLSGIYKGMRGEAPIAGTITGNEFDLTVKLETKDASLVVQYKGVVTGDTLAGRVIMGQLGEASFTGARSP
jgi:hypothetical protein